jgi:eukaryotic-like serine/threonine-protein kinase
MPMDTPSWFWVGPVLVLPDRLVFVIDSQERQVEPRLFDVLHMLVNHAGEPVKTDALLLNIWGSKVYGDNPVQTAISRLRTALGDDARNPRYIETIPKQGYRLIADVVYPEGYRAEAPKNGKLWSGGNPYVGLAAFDSKHSAVFCGRSRATADLLGAMRAQIDQERRFVLIVGASGCGKSSLLHAGALPALRMPEGFDGLRALTETHCNLATAQGGDILRLLATALSAWVYYGRPVFAPEPAEDLAARLCERPESAKATIDDALERHKDRKLDAQPHAHLLLTIDHSEALVASDRISKNERETFWHAIEALCGSPRVLVIMLVRSDFYPKLIQALPGMAERKSGNGHLDLLPPLPGEITQMIREPAYLAKLTFEEDENTRQRLDDALRDAAIRQPDALPLLQHTLHTLFERCKDSIMTFDAYHEIGGLEGAIAHRAEEVFIGLSPAAQNSLGRVLSLLAVIESDSENVSARHALHTALTDDAGVLVDAFIQARLFVGGQDDGYQRFGVAHEALLRQWPRARDWAQDNYRLLQARARLKKATVRWADEGQQDDHLLNSGRPLAEAIEAASMYASNIDEDEREFLRRSERNHMHKRKMKRIGVSSLIALTILSIATSVLALVARKEANKRSEETLRLAEYVLIPFAQELKIRGHTDLLSGIGNEALAIFEQRVVDDLSLEEKVSLARTYRSIGEAMLKKMKYAEAESALASAKSVIESAMSQSTPSFDVAHENGIILYYLGDHFYRQNALDKAEIYWKKYDANSDLLMKLDNSSAIGKMEKSYSLHNLGTLAYETGDIDSAIDLYRGSAKFKRSAMIKGPDANLQKEYIDTLSAITSSQEKVGMLETARRDHSTQIDDISELLESSSHAASWKRYLANAMIRKAHLDARMGKIESAIALIDDSIEHLESSIKMAPNNGEWHRDLARAHMEAGDIQTLNGNIESRDNHLSSARRIMDRLLSTDHSDAEWKRLHSLIVLRQAMSSQNKQKALTAADWSVGVLTENFESSPKEVSAKVSLAGALIVRGKMRARERKSDQARRDWTLAASLLREQAISSRNPDLISTYVTAKVLLEKKGEVLELSQWLSSIGYRRHALENAFPKEDGLKSRQIDFVHTAKNDGSPQKIAALNPISTTGPK